MLEKRQARESNQLELARQSLAIPSTAEYWHIGEIMIRSCNVTLRKWMRVSSGG